jgi:AcrR family transcriptional regulator
VSAGSERGGDRAGADEAPARPRGRPRSEEAHQAILMATITLLPEHGLALPIETVAAEAGVGKTTIYRRWKNKNELIADAIGLLRPPPGSMPDTGSLVGDLNAISRAQRDRLGDSPVPRVIPRLLADSAEDGELHALIKERAVGPIRDIIRVTVQRAMDRGELRDDVDIELVVDVFHALPVYRILMSGGRLDEVVPMPEIYVPLLMEGLSSSSAGRASARRRSSGSSRAKRARSG